MTFWGFCSLAFLVAFLFTHFSAHTTAKAISTRAPAPVPAATAMILPVDHPWFRLAAGVQLSALI